VNEDAANQISPLLAEFEGKYVDRYLIANGLRLHYTEWGRTSDDGTWWMFVGGVIQHAHVWDPIAASLGTNASVVCLDLRGQGDSDWARDGYRQNSFVEEVHAVITALRRSRPVNFVGHSLGARIGIGLAARYPDDLNCLILSDTGPDVPRNVAFAVKDEVESYFSSRGYSTYEKAIAQFAAEHPSWTPVFHHLYAYRGLKWNWADRLIPKADPGLRWITSAATKGEIEQMWSSAAEVRVPTLLLRGVKPNSLAFVADETVAKLEQRIKNFAVLPMNTGHYIPFEDTDGFLKESLVFARSFPS
jgi:pimeloyl-ACP methyl ester carboxylesterase